MSQKICPICNINPVYSKIRIVKVGKTFRRENGSYYFEQTGTRQVKDEWWSCKECANKMSVDEYANALIHIFNNHKVKLF